MGDVNLWAWCGGRVRAFRDFEAHEWAAYPSPEHRDRELVGWVVRTLANPELPESAAVLELIQQHRADGAS